MSHAIEAPLATFREVLGIDERHIKMRAIMPKPKPKFHILVNVSKLIVATVLDNIFRVQQQSLDLCTQQRFFLSRAPCTLKHLLTKKHSKFRSILAHFQKHVQWRKCKNCNRAHSTPGKVFRTPLGDGNYVAGHWCSLHSYPEHNLKWIKALQAKREAVLYITDSDGTRCLKADGQTEGAGTTGNENARWQQRQAKHCGRGRDSQQTAAREARKTCGRDAVGNKKEADKKKETWWWKAAEEWSHEYGMMQANAGRM
jgi:hypothetical protein